MVTKLQDASRTWRKDLRKIASFKNIRDKTAGHYDPNIAEQIQFIESVDENDAFTAFEAFLSYNIHVLGILRDIGRNNNV